MTANIPNLIQRALASIEKPLVAVSIGELLSHEFALRERLLSPWLTTQSLSMIHAWRGQGKTHVALGIAYALASGGKFLNWYAEKPCSVLYIDGEMPGAALQERLSGIASVSETHPEPELLRFITPDLQPDGVMPNLSTYDGQDALEPFLLNAKVIIVDNISCLCRGGKENDAESWNMISEWALRMRASGRSVIFIHHSGKGGQQRGTSRREDILDTVIALRPPNDYDPAQGARFEVHYEKARSMFGSDVTPIEAHLQADRSWLIKDAIESVNAKMIDLAELGLSQTEIARELDCNKSTVSRALKRAEKEGIYKPLGSTNTSKKGRDSFND